MLSVLPFARSQENYYHTTVTTVSTTEKYPCVNLSSGMLAMFSHSNNIVNKIWIPSRTLKSQVKS